MMSSTGQRHGRDDPPMQGILAELKLRERYDSVLRGSPYWVRLDPGPPFGAITGLCAADNFIRSLVLHLMEAYVESIRVARRVKELSAGSAAGRPGALIAELVPMSRNHLLFVLPVLAVCRRGDKLDSLRSSRAIMRSIAASRWLFGVAWLFFAASVLAAQVVPKQQPQSRTMGDPLFGMSYDTTVVRFDRAPAQIVRLCPELRGSGLWLYGASKTPVSEFYILSGLVKVRRDGPARVPVESEPDGGIAVELRGSECRVSSLDWLLSEKPNPSPTAPRAHGPELRALISDALRRYVAAFGGRQRFLRKLQQEHVSLADLPLILSERLKAFEKSE